MQIRQPFTLRHLQHHDCQSVLAIQSACYPDHLIESSEALLAKCKLSPESCWLAEHEGAALGYLFSHPWHDKSPPALDSPLTALPAEADTFFLHDLAIHPLARGQGIAQALLQQAMIWAKKQNLHKAMLVAVQNSQAFWQRHGFDQQPVSPELQVKLAGYGAGATCLHAHLLAQHTGKIDIHFSAPKEIQP